MHRLYTICRNTKNSINPSSITEFYSISFCIVKSFLCIKQEQDNENIQHICVISSKLLGFGCFLHT